MSAEPEREVRLALFRLFVQHGRRPEKHEVAREAGVGVDEVSAAYERLAADRAIVLTPAGDDVWMANPLSATPTAFRVEVGERSYWGSCIWDALGVVAMLGGDGSVRTACPDCSGPLAIAVRGGALERSEGIGHFAVPAARWWENIAFT